MCGIVGLLIKNPAMRGEIGALGRPMLKAMSERGPDSAGFAVFTQDARPDWLKMSLLYDPPTTSPAFSWIGLQDALDSALSLRTGIHVRDRHARLTIPIAETSPEAVGAWLRAHHPHVRILSMGHSLEIYKDVGAPDEVARRYGFATFAGSHIIAHTRMATESAVSADRAHPFTAGHDFCLVHNGSLSNPHEVRRALAAHGIRFETDNDTEAACRFLEWRLREGASLEQALQTAFERLDGFFTFLIGTPDRLALIRDPFGCKPAVVAETEDYVAIASEFRALAHLPHIEEAHVFEPVPEEMYVWTP
jgi:amidophosphoribosyltransferase